MPDAAHGRGLLPMHALAMGFVIVVLDLTRSGFDLLPDLVGWVLVGLGVARLGRRLPTYGVQLGLVVVAALVAVVTYWPVVLERLDDGAGWLLSLPQLVFSILLCRSIGRLADGHGPGGAVLEPDPVATRRFHLMSWVFGVLAVAPAAVYGGGVDALLVPVAVLSVAVHVYLVLWLFRVARRSWALP